MISLDYLLPESRQRVLSLLLLNPQTRYHVREIARLTDLSAGTLHKDLSRLAKSQILIREVSGQQVYYRANIDYFIFPELASILRKTSGLIYTLIDALSSVAEKIEVAFVYGSIARGTENSGSDIDILIIGEISFTDAVKTLYPAQTSLGREINPRVYRRDEWQKLLADKNSFIDEIFNKPKLFIIGTMDDIR